MLIKIIDKKTIFRIPMFSIGHLRFQGTLIFIIIIFYLCKVEIKYSNKFKTFYTSVQYSNVKRYNIQ